MPNSRPRGYKHDVQLFNGYQPNRRFQTYVTAHVVMTQDNHQREYMLCVRACQKYLRYRERFCDVIQSPCCIFFFDKK